MDMLQRFDGEDDIETVVREARAGEVLDDHRGFLTGALLGSILAGPFGLLGGGPLVGMIFGAGAGTVQGALAAGLIGSGLTDRSLKVLAERLQAGDVLVAIRCDDHGTEQKVETVLRRHGADIAEKTLPALPLPKFLRNSASQ